MKPIEIKADMRAEFEEWARRRAYPTHTIRDKRSPSNGQYAYSDVQLAWEAWCEALAKVATRTDWSPKGKEWTSS